MPEIQFFDLLHKIAEKEEKFSINILYGFNEFLGEKIVKAFTQSFLEEKSDFNYRRFYFEQGSQTSWDDVLEVAKSANFFVQSRKIVVVVIRDPSKLTISKSEKTRLQDYVRSPNPNTILIIYVSMNVTKDDFKQIKKQKISKLIGELKSPHSVVVDFDRIHERDVKGFIRSYFGKRKISITESALERLIEIKGEDFVSVLFQLSKFEIARHESKSIDSENIDEIITGIEAHSIWDLTDAIEKEDAVAYLKTLRYLFISGIKPTLIIGTLITHYNKIFTAKFLLDHHFPVSDIGKVLNQPSFILNRFITAVRNFSGNKIKHILDIIYKMDYESKTSGEESARLSLQNFIFQIGLLGKGS